MFQSKGAYIVCNGAGDLSRPLAKFRRVFHKDISEPLVFEGPKTTAQDFRLSAFPSFPGTQMVNDEPDTSDWQPGSHRLASRCLTVLSSKWTKENLSLERLIYDNIVRPARDGKT